jgi:hypothetical protein
LDSNHIPSCTSAGSVLQLCKVSQNSNEPFRRSFAYKVHGPPFRESISWIISPSKYQTATVFLHAHLQVVYYNCVKFHKNSISSLVGVALTRYMLLPFCESISWINSPFKFWTVTIFLHAHLQVNRNYSAILATLQITSYVDSRSSS